MSLTTLNGAISDANATDINTHETTAVIPDSSMILIDDEAILVGGVSTSHFTPVTRGAFGSEPATHLDNAPVYELKHVHYTTTGLEFYYVDTDGLHIRSWVNPAYVVPPEIPAVDAAPDNSFLRVSGSEAEWDTAKLSIDPVAEVTELTDSTGGTPAASLVAVRSDTAAHTADDANANFASLYAYAEAVADAVKALSDAVVAGTVVGD